jgi:hypothetical protein
VNGGAPTPSASPALRALRLDPVLVDDLALDARLAAPAAGATGARADVDPEIVRWARAWLVVWQGVLHAAGVIGAVPPSSVATRLADVPNLKGDPAGVRRAQAIALLEQLALLHRVDGASARLDDALFTRHRAGLEVDWAAATDACRYEPAALLVLRALVEVVIPPDAPTPVSLRELAGRTGYAEKQVRVALRRLAESGVVAATETAGQATRYRLTPATLGRVEPALTPAAAPTPPPAPRRIAPAPASAPAPVPPPAAAASAPALRLTLNGVTLGIAAGLAADVTLDADGLPHVTVRGPG